MVVGPRWLQLVSLQGGARQRQRLLFNPGPVQRTVVRDMAAGPEMRRVRGSRWTPDGADGADQGRCATMHWLADRAWHTLLQG